MKRRAHFPTAAITPTVPAPSTSSAIHERGGGKRKYTPLTQHYPLAPLETTKLGAASHKSPQEYRNTLQPEAASASASLTNAFHTTQKQSRPLFAGILHGRLHGRSSYRKAFPVQHKYTQPRPDKTHMISACKFSTRTRCLGKKNGLPLDSRPRISRRRPVWAHANLDPRPLQQRFPANAACSSSLNHRWPSPSGMVNGESNTRAERARRCKKWAHEGGHSTMRSTHPLIPYRLQCYLRGLHIPVSITPFEDVEHYNNLD